MEIEVKVQLTPLHDMLSARELLEGQEAQFFVDSEVMRLSHPFTPFETGDLSRSSIRATRVGSGVVEYDSPYARRLYYNPQYNFQGAPQRGARWFERMKAQHLKSILEGAAKVTGGEYE